MKTTSNFKEEAPRCSNCRHSFYAVILRNELYTSTAHYYCNSDGTCPYKTQEAWNKISDKPWSPRSRIAKWLGFQGVEEPDPDTSERYVGFSGEGICDDYEPKETKNEDN